MKNFILFIIFVEAFQLLLKYFFNRDNNTKNVTKKLKYKFSRLKNCWFFIFDLDENSLSEKFVYNVFHTLNDVPFFADKNLKRIYLTSIYTIDGDIFNLGKSFQVDPSDLFNSHKYAAHIMCSFHILEDKAYPLSKSGSFIVKVYLIDSNSHDW